MNSRQIEELLLENFSDIPEEGIHEDLQILQPDGSRACISYELSGRGYQLIDPMNLHKQ